MSPTQTVRTPKGSTYEQDIIGESELAYSMRNLQKVLEKPDGKNKYGWDELAKLLQGKDYKFANGEVKYVLDQVELMLKLWGAGTYGKKIVTGIAKKCLGNDTLDNIGTYVAGTTVELGGGKKANITATNPVALWINEYRSMHPFSRPREEAKPESKTADVVPARVDSEPLKFEKPTPEGTEEPREPATRGFLQTKTERAKWSEALKKGKPEEMGFRANLKAVKVPVFDMEKAPEVKLPKLEEEKFYFDMDAVRKAKEKPPFISGKKKEPLPYFYLTQTNEGKSANAETAARPKPVEIQEADLEEMPKAKTKPEFLGGAKTAEKTETPAQATVQKAAEQPAQSPAQVRNTLEGSAAEDALAPLEDFGLNVEGIPEISTRLGEIAKKMLNALIGMKDEELKAEGTRGFLNYFNKLPAEKRAKVLENLDILVNDVYLSEGSIQNYIRNFDNDKKAYIEAVIE
ncbi:MAG: hypothetical protein WC488_02145 [Candidatus Micrarchaeia archaeon]